jgi:hypothetical protein
VLASPRGPATTVTRHFLIGVCETRSWLTVAFPTPVLVLCIGPLAGTWILIRTVDAFDRLTGASIFPGLAGIGLSTRVSYVVPRRVGVATTARTQGSTTGIELTRRGTESAAAANGGCFVKGSVRGRGDHSVMPQNFIEGCRDLTAGEKSRVTGDCHAGIRGSRALRCPRRPDNPTASDAGPHD